MLVLMMLLLADFFGVRDVSWVSHQLIDGFQGVAGRISEQTTHKHDGVTTALCRRAGPSNTAKVPRHSEAATTFARWLLAFRENFAQSQSCRMIPAHAVNAAARRRGSRTQIDPRQRRAIWSCTENRSRNSLHQVRCAAGDFTAGQT